MMELRFGLSLQRIVRGLDFRIVGLVFRSIIRIRDFCCPREIDFYGLVVDLRHTICFGVFLCGCLEVWVRRDLVFFGLYFVGFDAGRYGFPVTFS